MNYLMKLIYRLPSVRTLVKENKALKADNSFLRETIEEIVVQNYLGSSHIETKVSSSKPVKENAPVPKELKKAVDEITKDTSESGKEAFTFSKENVKTEDNVATLAEEIVSRNPFGMASADYTGEPVKYQEMTEEDLNNLLKFCYDNAATEVNLVLGDKQTAIIEGHRDKTLSVEVYEDGHHLKSMKTGKKVINDEVVEDFNDHDIINCLNSYGHRG